MIRRYVFNDPALIFQPAILFGKTVIFTKNHISKAIIPDGLYSYSIRHHEDDCQIPVRLEIDVLVDHFGDILCKEPYAELIYSRNQIKI